MRRMLVLLSAVGLVGVFVVALGVASGSSAGRRGSSADKRAAGAGASPGKSAGSGASSGRAVSLARARRAAVARRRWLGSPVARVQRARSRMAFSGLGAGAARRLVVGDFGSFLAGVSANPAASVARSGRIVRYLSDYRVLVRGRRGLEVERSSVPLRVVGGGGVKRPVDLRLARSAGGFAAVRPLAGVSIAGDSAGGVGVGGDGLRVTLQGAKVVGVLVGGQDVFFGGVARDTDAVVAPTIDGVELFGVLRSRLSPEKLRYRVSLPAGAVLRAVSGVRSSRVGVWCWGGCWRRARGMRRVARWGWR
jgi:hypothetical protein